MIPSRIENKICQRAEELLERPLAIMKPLIYRVMSRGMHLQEINSAVIFEFEEGLSQPNIFLHVLLL